MKRMNPVGLGIFHITGGSYVPHFLPRYVRSLTGGGLLRFSLLRG